MLLWLTYVFDDVTLVKKKKYKLFPYKKFYSVGCQIPNTDFIKECESGLPA